MKTVRQMLRDKSDRILSVAPDATVFEALQLMADKEVGALLVLEGGRLVGIMSERDYARKVVLLSKTSRETSVREIMTEKVMFVRPEQTVEECMALMTEKRCRHLPVFDGDKLLGVLSIGDLVKEFISEQDYIIKQMEQYIHG